jgi:hypothetical protein
MYDFTLYDLQDLFKVRDACVVLSRYDLENHDLMSEVNKEIQERERKYDPDNPDHERDKKD